MSLFCVDPPIQVVGSAMESGWYTQWHCLRENWLSPRQSVTSTNSKAILKKNYIIFLSFFCVDQHLSKSLQECNYRFWVQLVSSLKSDKLHPVAFHMASGLISLKHKKIQFLLYSWPFSPWRFPNHKKIYLLINLLIY